MINESESNRKAPKMFAGKNLQMTQKALRARPLSKKLIYHGLRNFLIILTTSHFKETKYVHLK